MLGRARLVGYRCAELRFANYEFYFVGVTTLAPVFPSSCYFLPGPHACSVTENLQFCRVDEIFFIMKKIASASYLYFVVDGHG